MWAGMAHAPAEASAAWTAKRQSVPLSMSLQARQLLPSTTRQQRQQQAAAQRLVSDGQRRQRPATAGSKRGSVNCTAFAAPSSLPRGDGVDYPNALSFLPDLSQQQASQSLDATPQPLPRRVEGAVDDPALANPLQRHLRLGTDWMGVIVEYEGIVSALPTAISLLSPLR